MLPCSRSWTRTASLNLDCSFSQTCVANAHVTTSFVCFFFVDGSLDDSFMLVSLMVVPGHVDVVLFCLLDGIFKSTQTGNHDAWRVTLDAVSVTSKVASMRTCSVLDL